jgi:hypothetical protein
VLEVTRNVAAGPGRYHRAPVLHAAGCAQVRPASHAVTPAMVPMSANWSGPVFKGMDPSDPRTHVRPWNPAPGMIAQLNYDGAALQGTTPTGLQRGPQSRRPRRLRVSP